jgi:non-heme chloroperoxidase
MSCLVVTAFLSDLACILAVRQRLLRRTGVQNFLIRLLALTLVASAAGYAREPAWHDMSKHQVEFVTVEDGVKLEVLDWGGSGRPVVLLAGSGNTAHVYDDIAPKLTGFCHVYGITRRGYGTSSHTESGYSERRLAQDILQVLDSLKLVKPVLVGHSMAGEELTGLGNEHSDRLGGLIYLEAAADPTDFPASSPAYMSLFDKLPAGRRAHPEPTASDLKSFQAYREWKVRIGEVPFPESELRNIFETNPDGSVGKYNESPRVHEAIGAGAQKRDYSKIRVPILALFSWSCSNHPYGNYRCIEHPHYNPLYEAKPQYQPKSTQERAAMDAFDDATLAYINRWHKNLLNAPGGVRLVALPGADHYMFISNEVDVLSELRAFLVALR